MIFSAFSTKIPQSIGEVELQYPGAQNSENFKNRKNGLKHLGTILETTIGYVEVLQRPIPSLTCHPILGDFDPQLGTIWGTPRGVSRGGGSPL